MSSSERYIVRTGDESVQDPTQSNLLPAEFQWQPPAGTTSGGTTYSDQTAFTTPPNNIPVEGGTGTNQQIYGTGYDSNYVNGWPATTDTTGGQTTQGTVVDQTNPYQGYITDQGQVTTNGGYTTDQGYIPTQGTVTDQQGYQVNPDGTVVQPTGVYGSDVGTTYNPGSGQGYPTDGQTNQSQNNGGLPPWTPSNTDGGMVQPGVDANGQPVDANGQPIAAQPRPQGDQSTTTSDSGKGGGGPDLMWWADRGISLGVTGLTAAKTIPNLATLMPEGRMIPSLEALKGVPKNEWLTAGRTNMGKAMGGAWIADTLLDATVLGNKETSWKTLAVDIATPLVLSRLPGASLAKTLGFSVGAHVLEKMLFEDDKEK